MKLYLTTLIQRLKEYSANLDKIELFVDVPWVIVDENLNQQKYIFKRDGQIIMSLNGQVIMGKWELLPAARSILIDRIQDKILLNQNFIDPAVMVLKKDGFNDENLILANEILIPDLNVTEYLKQLYYEKNRVIIKKLKNGDLLEIVYEFNNSSFSRKVTIEDEPVPDGEYELDDFITKYLVKDSRIINKYVNTSYSTNKGEIVIAQQYPATPSLGDLVYQNNNMASDGKYRLGFWYNIIVKDGRIIKK
jgi:hypothetical protein